jgi:hypothetical protein
VHNTPFGEGLLFFLVIGIVTLFYLVLFRIIFHLVVGQQ